MAQIELNKEQYLRLLKALGITSMMEEFISKDDAEEEVIANKNYEFEDYLLGYAKEFDLDVSDNEEEDDWFDDIMADAYDLANEYGESDMFQRLAWQLALINFQQDNGREFNADSDEDFEKAMDSEEKYLNEFEENGLVNVKIVK